MRAARIHNHGGPEVLQIDDIPEPICPSDGVKVKIHAASLNHLDIWIREGIPGLPIELPLIPGSDGSGEIVEVGAEISGWKVGDAVVIQPGTFCGNCDFCRKGQENYCIHYGIIGETVNGTDCDYFITKPENLHKKAHHLSWEEAASLQLVSMTAYQMLIPRANLQKGETVLIYGATSGIGSAAIQIAKHIGASVITTVGSEEKQAHAEKMGADFVILHSQDNWIKEVKKITGRQGIQVIFEHIGQATWQNSMRLLGKGGRVVTCGATTGPKVDFDLRHLFMKQQTILGSTMSDMKSFKAVQELIHQKIITPFVDKIFPLEEISDAHRYLENRKQFGKVCISI